MNQIIEKCYDQNIQIHILFLDFKQAFDSLKREMILKDKIRISRKLIRLTKMIINGSKAVVITEEGFTKVI